jgi:hypothetical protein
MNIIKNSVAVKKCSTCKEEKDVNQYLRNKFTKDGLGSYCLSCRKDYHKKWRLKNPRLSLKTIAKKELLLKGKKKCTKCGECKAIDMFHNSKISKDGLSSNCKACYSEYDFYKRNERKKAKKKLREETKVDRLQKQKEKQKQYYIDNKQKFKEYYIKNKTKLNKQRTKWHMERYNSDSLFKMTSNLRSRTSNAFKKSRWNKNSSNIEMLGCSFETAHKHLERQFTKGMNWGNQGEWHIDHIIPLASAKTEEDLINLCHYTNLQPLWAKDNLSKGASIDNQQGKLRL